MKKLLAMLLVLLCLAGCGNEAEQPPVEKEQLQILAEEAQTETQPEEQPEEPETVEVEEVPMTVNKEETEETSQTEPAEVPEHTMTTVEGLVEDTVGYALDCPVFSDLPAADAINKYYVDLTGQLGQYARETIYSHASKNLLTASVYGIVETMELSGEELKITYLCRVLYSDKQVDENIKTDYFNIQTGEIRSE